jgi:hypothetical protein
MNANKGSIEFLHHLAERSRQRGAPADQHIVTPGPQRRGPGSSRQAHDFAQTAADSVSLHGVADLAGYRKADPDGIIPRPLQCLKHKSAAGGTYTTSRGSKIAAAFQPLDDGRLAILFTH